jgi:tetratricopeptide (TPR) repeat protein
MPKWIDDLRLAKTIAKAEGKDILLEFVRPAAASKPAPGVDPRSLLDSAVFLPRARATFVLMRLTVSPEAAPDQIARIGTWIGRLAVTQYPTFILLDANGAPYDRSELAANRVSVYRREFAKLREIRSPQDRVRALASAARTAAVSCQPNPITSGLCSFAFARSTPSRRRATERDSATAGRKIDRVIDEEVSPLISRRQYPAALARLDKLIAETNAPRDQRQTLLALKGEVYLGLNDKQASTKVLDQAIAIDPNSESARRAREIKHRLEK